MKKLCFQSITLLASFLVFFSACKKSSSNPSSTVADQQQFTAVSASDAEAEDVYNNVFDNVVSTNSNVGLGTGVGVFGLKAPKKGTYGGPITPCYTVTIDTTLNTGFPKTVTLDFGTGCTGIDGHVRSGQIITLFTGPLSQTGSIATTTFQNYYVDNVAVTGTHIITNSSTGSALVFNVQVVNGMLTASNGNSIAWNRTKTWTQTAGQGSQDLADYVFSITGSSSGTVTASDSSYQWTTNISSTNPEIRKLSCAWIVQGQNEITWNTFDAIINYGSGACDDQATVTTSKGTFSITLL